MTHIDHPVWRPVRSLSPIPEPPPSFRYPEEPVSIPMRGLVGSVFR